MLYMYVKQSSFDAPSLLSTERTRGERAFVSRSLDMDMKPALASVGSQFIKDGDLTLQIQNQVINSMKVYRP